MTTTTRIRINTEGQLTETRNVNGIKINGQNKTTDQYPAEVIRDSDEEIAKD